MNCLRTGCGHRALPGLCLLLVMCGQPASGARVHFSLRGTATETWPTPLPDERSYRESFASLAIYPLDQSSTHLFFQHRYSAIGLAGVRGADPASNGHVHELTLGVWVEQGAWRFLYARSLAVSSNVLKSTDHVRLSDLRLEAAIYHVTRAENGTWRYGVRADAVFGAFRVYPAVQWRTRIGRVRLRLGFPVTRVRWPLQPHWRLHLSLRPDGGLWHVRNDDYTRVTRLRLQRLTTRLALEWRPLPSVSLRLGLAHYAFQQWSWHLRNGQRVTVAVPRGINPFLRIDLRL